MRLVRYLIRKQTRALEKSDALYICKGDDRLTYYAHSIFKYNTQVEQYEMSLIPGDIINPIGFQFG
jgi:hypothetical protein